MESPLNLKVFFLVLLTTLTSISVNAQCTAGAVTQAHSSSTYDNYLDPDGDGYITESGAAFTNGTTELSEFEILPNSTTGWIEIQDVSETGSDITPNCGNPDLITDNNGGDFSFYNIIDPTPGAPTSGDEFITLRFRLAKSPNGNFGYNFLFDTDNNYGAATDPNSLCGNNGFEREVQFANAGGKKGVSVYDVDGTTSMAALSPPCSQCIAVSDIQEACAFSSGGCPISSSGPQFISFTLPLSHIGIDSDIAPEDLYISVATASSGNATSVLGGGNVTDFGAINGDDGGCPSCVGLTGCTLFDCQANCVYTTFLPVELVYFQAEVQNESINLNWSTATEINNSHFEIEHSTDGSNFRKVGILKGWGNSIDTHDYKFIHYKPEEGQNYYRLKQVDFNGTFEYSKVEVVSYKTKVIDFNIIPTTASSNIKINIKGMRNSGLITIVDLNGRVLQEVSFEEGQNSLIINTNQLAPGFYFAQLRSKSEILNKRFIKK